MNYSLALMNMLVFLKKVPDLALKTLFISFIALFLTSCTCDCIKNMPDLDLNSTTQLSNVSVLANGCGAIDGSVGSNGITTTLCGVANTTDYTNMGRWVKLPNIGSSADATLNLNIYGSVYYCSYGVDNKNPSPSFKASPGAAKSTLFQDGTEMVVMPGQLIVLAQNPKDKVQFSKASLPDCTYDSTGFNGFINGSCAASNLFGLTVYVNNTEIVTLDATTITSGTPSQVGDSVEANPLNYSVARTPNLFSYTSVPPIPGVQSTNLQSVIDYFNSTYQTTMNQDYALGSYIFMVPNNISGKIGFSVASSQNYGSTNTKGSYVFNVMTTPPACYVLESAAFNEPDQRGALQMLVSSSNPNYIDDALEAFDSLTNTQISDYYSSLRNYIAQYAGVTISENAKVLSDLVIPPLPNLTPTVIVQSTYSGTMNSSGSIWFKIRDDYYIDNVGQYDVYASVTKKNNSQVSSFISNLTTPVIDSINSATTAIYYNFYNSIEFLKLVRACLLLSIVILGFFYTLGLTQISAHDLLVRVCKIAVVSQLFSPNSWTFFNDYLFKIFTEGSNYLIAAATGDTSPDKHNLFSFVDDAFNIFFQSATWVKIAALMMDVVGILALATIIVVMILYILTIAKVIISYLMCILALSLLIALSPIFIMLILFQRTKKYFDSWISSLADYALQSVILFVSFYLISQIFVTMWLNLMSYDVCYGGIKSIPLSINLSATVAGITLPNIYLGCPWWFVITDGTSYYVLVIQSLTLFIFAYVLRGFIGHISSVTAKITGSSAVHGVDKIGQSIEQDAKTFAKEAPKQVAIALVNKVLQFAPSSWGTSLKGGAGGGGGLVGAAAKVRRGGLNK